MSYFAPYVDATGLHLPTYQDILDDLVASAKTIYGDDIYLKEDSADYQLLSIFALKSYDNMQALAYCYASRSPGTALGAGLDGVVKLNGIARKAAGYSTCDVALTGTAFTQISGGKVKDASGNIWDLPATVTIGSGGTITTTATCEEVGAISALAGDITDIVTPTYGWTAVNNAVAAVVGQAQETDAEVRVRQAASVALPSQALLDGTKAALAAVADVDRVEVYENDTNSAAVDATTNPYGLPAHSVTCVVEGGVDDSIAAEILAHKTPGCYLNGTTVVTKTDSAGMAHTVRFYRPTYKPIYVKAVIRKYANYVTSVNDAVKAAIYQYLQNLAIGMDVSVSVLSSIAISQNADVTTPTFGLASMTIGTAAGSLAAADVTIGFNEIAQGSLANITVEVES